MKHGIYYAYWEQEWRADYHYYVEKAARLGFDVLEIAASPLPEYTQGELLALRQAAEAHGVVLTVGHGPSSAQNIASADASVRERTLAFYAQLFRQMEVLGAEFLGGGLYSYWPVNDTSGIDREADWARSVEGMQKMAKLAGDCGITLGMEVLNRFEGYLLNTAEEGVCYVEAVDSPNVKLMLDTFHMNVEEASLGGAIRKAGRHLGHFHTGECDRMVPGTGRMPWREIAEALADINYQGRVVMEPFVRQGGTVGRDVRIWRNLVDDSSEQTLDKLAREALWFQRHMFG